MGAPEATATMSRDHVEVGRLTEELGSLRSHLVGAGVSASQEKALRRALYRLSAVVRVHFAKEEEIYLPILDAGLTPKEAHRMFEAMERRHKRQRAPWGNDPRYGTNVLRGRVFYALKHTVGVKHPRYVTLVALPRTALGRVAHVP